LALITIPALLVILAIDSAPLVPASENAVFSDVQDLKAVVRRFDPRRMSPDAPTEVTASQEELSQALMATLAATGFARGKVTLNPLGVVIAATADLPISDVPFGRHVNVSVLVLPSEDGLEIAHLAVGDVEVPRSLIEPSLVFAIEQMLGDGKGEELFASVRSVRTTGTMLSISLQPPATLVADLRAAAANVVPDISDESINAYFEVLRSEARARGQGESLSFAKFVGPVFDLARTRSQGGSAIEENRAAILALALYFGDSRFGSVLRNVPGASESRETGHVLLEGRHDWVQHFVTSAGLTVLGGTSLADMIGVGKEVMDSDGPSGFSFTDVAADRAGVRFAEVATGSPLSAKRLQERMSAGVIESSFFPRVGDLPEGLSADRFRAEYGDMSSPDYQRLAGQIERRIADIPLYQ
jgi:hypothetical protein